MGQGEECFGKIESYLIIKAVLTWGEISRCVESQDHFQSNDDHHHPPVGDEAPVLHGPAHVGDGDHVLLGEGILDLEDG